MNVDTRIVLLSIQMIALLITIVYCVKTRRIVRQIERDRERRGGPR